MKRFAGVFTPLVTPFIDGEVHEAGLRANIARLLESPLHGFVVLGSNGEAPQLDDHEADAVIDIARDAIPRDRPLIVGTGRESTRATLAASRRAAERHADAVLVRTPSFFKPQMDAEAYVRHYSAVADASPIPVFLYNVTLYTGVHLPAAAVERLATHPNIVGMKESGGDMAYIAECIVRTPDTFTMLAGSATTYFNALCTGCDGGILAVAALVPDLCVSMWELVKAQRIEAARELQRTLTPLARTVGSAHGVPGLKAALDLLGYAGGLPRAPLLPAPETVVATLRTQLEQLGRLPREVNDSQRPGMYAAPGGR